MYHVGLPLLANQPMDVFVRVSVFSSQEHRYLSMLTSLSGDPDLSSVPRGIIPKVIQTLFICTSCDYVSYFAGYGKATFLRLFFQHAEFITTTCIGTLANTCGPSQESGIFEFCTTCRYSVYEEPSSFV